MTLEEKVRAIAQALGIVDSDRKKTDERLDNIAKFCEGLLTRMNEHEEELKKLKASVANIDRHIPKQTKPFLKSGTFTYEMWKRVHDLHANGSSGASISGMLNVPRSSVYKYIRMTEEAAQKLPHEVVVPDLPAPDTSVALKLEESYD